MSNRIDPDAEPGHGAALPKPGRKEDAEAPPAGLSGTFMEVLKGLLPFMAAHRRWLAGGFCAAVAVTIARLALPWPLRVIADHWMHGTAGSGVTDLPFLGLAFFCAVTALGLFDLLTRDCYARFALGTVNDLRAATYTAAIARTRKKREGRTGDLIARIVGDAARVKSGLQGFLVHTSTSALLLTGVVIYLFTLHTTLAVVFAVALLGTLLVIASGAVRMFEKSVKNRKKEGKLADRIHADLMRGEADKAFARINKKSGRQESSQVRTQGVLVWVAHVMYGAAVVAALWVGVGAVESGEIAAGDMVLFMMYALMLRGPIVRMARQGTRTGKILGAAHRMIKLCRKGERSPRPARVT